MRVYTGSLGIKLPLSQAAPQASASKPHTPLTDRLQPLLRLARHWQGIEGHDGHPGRVKLLKLDLDSLDSVRAAVPEFLAKSKALNILINNAGVMATPEGKTERWV